MIRNPMNECAWCKKYITDENEVFGMGITVVAGMDLTKYEGDYMPLELGSAGKTIQALVTTTGSQAKQDGQDLMCMTCSESCGKELKKALDKDFRDNLKKISWLN